MAMRCMTSKREHRVLQRLGCGPKSIVVNYKRQDWHSFVVTAYLAL